ncbi:hypothetical protein AKO1_011812 [Acrasis kona]|uniref:BRCT domain-containing protein n=1 Tax=Acrasis kona TaxID=1008807 RepID=A0AAW2Z5L5_9EUKA
MVPTSAIFLRKSFFFLGNFKQYNNGLDKKDLEKCVTNNGGSICLSIHSVTGKNSFLVVAADPNVSHEYINIAKKNKANIVPVTFITKSLDLLHINRGSDINELRSIVDDKIKQESCQDFTEMFTTNVSASERVKELEHELQECMKRTEDAELTATRTNTLLENSESERSKLEQLVLQLQNQIKECNEREMVLSANIQAIQVEKEKIVEECNERDRLTKIAIARACKCHEIASVKDELEGIDAQMSRVLNLAKKFR